MEDPLITFYRMLPGLPPRRASNSAAGTLPTRAFQYCEPSRLASGLGYYVFLPMAFQIEWDGGTGAIWSFDDGAHWYPLSTAAFPDSMAAWDAIASENCRGYCPPFLTLTEDHAIIQVWTGWMARTAPGYSLIVRGPANLSMPTSYQVFEGVVESDHWFGPLFANIRIAHSGRPILFDDRWPFLQVLPIQRVMIGECLNNLAIVDGAEMSADMWSAYEESLIVPVIQKPERGHYAKAARRRAASERCPVSDAR